MKPFASGLPGTESVVSSAAGVSVKQAISALDAEDFANLITRNNLSDAPSQPPVERPHTATDAGSLGDAILHGLQQAGADWRGRWQDIMHAASGTDAPPSVSDLLRTQMQLTALTFETELTSTALRKASSAIDQVLHMQ